MHFEILVEDKSGKKALDILVPKIIQNNHTFKVIAYKGIGRIPRNLSPTSDPKKRILLDQLPRLLRGYGKTYPQNNRSYPVNVIIVCDLDDKSLDSFHKELLSILDNCRPQPNAFFCFAIEEGEAWFLGDLPAINNAYPNAISEVLNSYNNDSICETWEKLADAIYPGGSLKLKNQPWFVIGEEKSIWAEKISPNMDINNNESPSFCYFRDKLLVLAEVLELES